MVVPCQSWPRSSKGVHRRKTESSHKSELLNVYKQLASKYDRMLQAFSDKLYFTRYLMMCRPSGVKMKNSKPICFNTVLFVLENVFTVIFNQI